MGGEEAPDSMREYVVAQGVKDGMSANVGNPWAATRLPGGSVIGKVVNIELVSDYVGESAQWLHRHENQQRSLRGVTDDGGFRKAEIDYSEYGIPYVKKVLWDGGAGEYIEDVTHDDSESVVVLTAIGGVSQPVSDHMLGALARVVIDSAPWVLFGRVTAVNEGSQTFRIEDPSGDIHAALTSDPPGILTVFDHHDRNIDNGAVHTAGAWEAEDSVIWDNINGVTECISNGSKFPSCATGWFLQPNAAVPVFFPITAASAVTLEVAGNLEGVANEGGYYFIIPPAGVDKTTGALSTDPADPTSRYLAFGYHYTPPVAGIRIESTTYGSQPGINLAGHYYCHHRRYDPAIGRWTTPDPASTPWANLVDYVGSNPNERSDPTGCTWRGLENWAAGDVLDNFAKAAGHIEPAGTDEITKAARKSELLAAIDNTQPEDVLFFIGHGSKTTLVAKPDKSWVAAFMGVPGLIYNFTRSGRIEEDELKKHGPNAKGTVILFSCESWHLRHHFSNARCFIGYEYCVTDGVARATANAMWDAVRSIQSFGCASWSSILHSAIHVYGKQHKASSVSAAEFPKATSGCSQVNVCAP